MIVKFEDFVVMDICLLNSLYVSFFNRYVSAALFRWDCFLVISFGGDGSLIWIRVVWVSFFDKDRFSVDR